MNFRAETIGTWQRSRCRAIDLTAEIQMVRGAEGDQGSSRIDLGAQSLSGVGNGIDKKSINYQGVNGYHRTLVPGLSLSLFPFCFQQGVVLGVVELGTLPATNIPIVLASEETIIPHPRDFSILVLSAFVCLPAVDSSQM